MDRIRFTVDLKTGLSVIRLIHLRLDLIGLNFLTRDIGLALLKNPFFGPMIMIQNESSI